VAGDLNGIRIGTQEVTRLGMDAATMEDIAGFIARIVVKGDRPESVRNDVIAFRRDYQTLHYVR
jgi:glycine hydroxymethyltransferase